MHKCLEDREQENVIYKDQAYNRKHISKRGQQATC